jgi:hypothetical protein
VSESTDTLCAHAPATAINKSTAVTISVWYE